MNLQEFLEQRFTRWSPPAPEVLTRTKHSITLDWHRLEPFVFLAGQLLYRLEKNEKVPPWCVVYRSAPWLESAWSEDTWASTDTDGTSATCFCMAVRCGYLKQVQGMLDERPELLDILNPTNGYTPLCIAVRKGDIGTVRLLLGAGAALDQPSATGQTALHVAALTACLQILQLLIEKGADFEARDVNGLRVEHYAVDSGDVEVLRHVMEQGGDLAVRDNNGWTPLFRALCQGASTAIIEELVVRGSDVGLVDRAGLPLTSVARIMTNRHGGDREAALRLVDQRYPHELALAHFTRLTNKIHHVHSVLRPPAPPTRRNLLDKS